MIYKNIYDMHTHSLYSFDANDSCESLCKAAKEKGLSGIAITDHLDIDDKTLDVRSFVREQYEGVLKTKEAFRGDFDVIKGIELGQGIYKKELSDEVLNTIDYDFVLGSIHNLENIEDFYFLELDKLDYKTLLTRYFEDLLKLAKWDKTDCLAHITYPFRYISGKYNLEINIGDYGEIIDEILETVIKNKKSIEINMSSIDKYHKDTMPNKEIIKRYKELGGRQITLGSDAHSVNEIGKGLDIAVEIIRECGFNEFTVYKKREPILIQIERN